MREHNTITGLRVHSSNGKTPTGFGGFTFEIGYHGVDLFVGENASGKTDRAIRGPVAGIAGLATFAKDDSKPYLENRPENTAITITVQTPTRAVPVERDISAQRGKAVTEADAAVKEWIGQLPTSWNLSDFVKATAGDRGKILDAVARAGGAMQSWDQDRAISEVRGLVIAAAEDDTDTTAGSPWMQPLQTVVERLTETRSGSDWLQVAEGIAFDLHSDANRQRKISAAHARELRAALPDAPDYDAGAVAAERDDLTRRLAAIDADADLVAKAQAAADRHAREGDHLRRAVDAAQQALSDLTPPAPLVDDGRVARAEDALRGAEAAMETDIPQCPDAPGLALQVEAARERLEQATAALDAPVPGYSGPEPAELRAAADARTTALEEAKAQHVAAQDALAAAAKAVETAEAEGRPARQAADEAAATYSQAAARVQTLESLSGADDCCVHCGQVDPLGIAAKLDGAREELAQAAAALDSAKQSLEASRASWKDANEVHKNAAVDLRDAADAVREADTAADRATRELAQAEERKTNHAATIVAQRKAAAESARAAIEGAEAALRRRIDEHEAAVVRQRKQALDDAQLALQAAIAAETGRKADHGAAIARHEDAVKAATERLESAKAALAEWQATDAPKVPAAPDAEQRATITARLTGLEAARDAWRDHQQAADAVETAEAAASADQLTWEASRALLHAIREARDALARAAYGPIHDAARDLLSDIEVEGFPMPYFYGPDNFGAETERGAKHITELSQSEAMITAAALVTALATVAGNPCRISLLDGIEAVQADHRAPLIRALVKARHDGKVDNVHMTMATTAPGTAEFEQALAPLRQIEGLAIHTCHKPSKGGHVETQVIGEPVQAARPATDGSAALDLFADTDAPF